MTVRISIDGRWSVEDMSGEFAALDYLYNVECIAQPQNQFFDYGTVYARAIPDLRKRNPYQLAVIRYFTREEWSAPLTMGVPYRLLVERIHYGSPGLQDVAGLGEALKNVIDFIKYLIEWKQRRDRHEADMRRATLEEERLEIENGRARLAFMREAGFSDAQVRLAVRRLQEHSRVLETLVGQGKITAIEKKHS